ncbi:MAG: putative photosynthetic complex assembly protein PuhE [Rhodobacteraceae bacterium]|nr:putative photosynthetic complex assembly protein PuhE [Paracoccaceae bacterium]
MAMTVLIALSAACFVWWFSTGAILVAVRLTAQGGRRAGLRMTLAAMPLLLLGGVGLWASLGDITLRGAYTGFLSAVVLWGWFELSFLSGAVTGPNLTSRKAGLNIRQRFLAAWNAIAYHELTLAVLILFAAEISWQAANKTGLWVLLVLYVARVSAKFNLFLGVAHANTEFLPGHLAHLSSHFGQARMNRFFPVSVMILTGGLVIWLQLLVAAEQTGAQASYALLASLTALALLEHMFMVLPWPDAKLWRWMLPGPSPKMTRQKLSTNVTELTHEF